MSSALTPRLASTRAVLSAVRESAFLNGLPDGVVERVLGLIHRAEFTPGELVLREGTPTPFLGIVVTGRIALRLVVPGRGTPTVLTVEPGELVGWSALVPPYRSTATAVALEATEVAILDAVTLRAEIAGDPVLAAALFPRVLTAVAGRLGESWSQLLDLFGGPRVDPW